MHVALLVPRLEGLDRDIVRALLTEGPTSQVRLLSRIGKVSPATLSRAVSRLVEQGIIDKVGATRNALFSLSPAAAHFALPPHKRTPVRYDPSRIGGYVPNVTRWLPKEAGERMARAAGLLSHALDASTYSRRIAERFLIDLAWASSHLEGNTYDYLEAEALIKFAEQADGHDWTEATMILNHKRAISLLLEAVDGRGVEPGWMFRLHSLLMRDLLDPAALGKVRDGSGDTRIGGSSYRLSHDPKQLSMDLGALCWAATEVEDPFEASFLLLAGTAYLQAFADGNKRTGRLACNLPLLRAGLPPMSFLAVTASEYIGAMLAFYELGDAGPLADVVSLGYVQAAPQYNAAVATQRAPRSAEIRHRSRINRAVSDLVHGSLEDLPLDVDDFIGEVFQDLSKQDRDIVAESIKAALAVIGPNNFDAWEVPALEAAAYAEAREVRYLTGSRP